ncbi:MAG TPA: DUF1249 domain-containing protein [Steroidobacteraceae bacterium]|nr:DUF1249 domain-containing protein [Steroidobacteraceae bacterium]
MLGDDLCAVSWRARPGSFVGLMTLYESNYIRLGWLAGDLRVLAGEHRSRAARDVELKLTVLERSPYTTMLQLTYVFGAEPEWPDAPDLAVRVYHDARVAEAHAFGAAARAGADRGDLGSRWARNVMLNKWLEYCVDRGHRFGAASS